MQTLRKAVHRDLPEAERATGGLVRGFMDRMLRAARGPWGRPVGRGTLALFALVFLSWLGARSAQSTAPPSSETGPELAALASVMGSGNPTYSLAAATASASGAGANRDAGSREPGVLGDGRVVLNVATAEQLCRLPGVGPSRAKQILDLRERLGRFRSPRELLRVRGIGPRTLERILPRVVLDAPLDGDAG